MSHTTNTNEKYLTPTEVAEMLLVSPVTVRQWARKGLLAARLTAGGHRRFALDEVRRFARDQGLAGAIEEEGVNRILVVDDDRALNRFLVELINSKHPEVEVDSAYDGFEAGRKVQAMKPDVVLLDIMMPGLDGFEVCKALKSDVDTLDIHVVAMTGHYSPEVAQKMLSAGADRFLRKPFGNDEILEACGLPVAEGVDAAG